LLYLTIFINYHQIIQLRAFTRHLRALVRTILNRKSKKYSVVRTDHKHPAILLHHIRGNEREENAYSVSENSDPL